MGTKEIIHILEEVDENYFTFQEHMLNTYGDQGHDVGDAANAMELFNNLLTQGHEPEEFIPCIVISLKYSEITLSTKKLHQFLESLKALDADTYNQIFTLLYSMP